MEVFFIAAQWFFSGLCVGFVLNGLFWITVFRGGGGALWQDD
jgi:hypothetical protein